MAMTKLAELTNCIKKLSSKAISKLLDTAKDLLSSESIPMNPNCPHCESDVVIRYGRKRGKQRFLCKQCGRTFVSTTHTIMAYSHSNAEIWEEVIQDTVHGCAIDYSAKNLGLSHQTVFNMRHKILLALQNDPDSKNILLGGVSELDETFVLDSYKGKQLPEGVARKARKHGAKAQKRGISNEYVCICTGIQRNGSAYAATINRAKPDAEELTCLFKHHISKGTLILCDGLKSYNVLAKIANCIIKDCNQFTKEETCFYHLNTVNGFHSFIKQRYTFYRGVATKYLNRYNQLFSFAYRNTDNSVENLTQTLLSVGRINYYHSNKDVKKMELLAI